jgi:TetR/AcrR family transcriptional regulator
MPVKDCQTKELIVETAMNVFFTEGRIFATTQEIADTAGVNRTLINYYFRSKKVLFNHVVRRAMKEFTHNSDLILSSDLPLKEKTERFIDDFVDKLSRYPYLESYLTIDILQQRLKKTDITLSENRQPTPMKQFLNEIKKEMESGNIPETKPVHFMMNIVSMVIYPQIMKPLQMKLLDLSEEEYQIILSERKQIILDILFPEKIIHN